MMSIMVAFGWLLGQLMMNDIPGMLAAGTRMLPKHEHPFPHSVPYTDFKYEHSEETKQRPGNDPNWFPKKATYAYVFVLSKCNHPSFRKQINLIIEFFKTYNVTMIQFDSNHKPVVDTNTKSVINLWKHAIALKACNNKFFDREFDAIVAYFKRTVDTSTIPMITMMQFDVKDQEMYYRIGYDTNIVIDSITRGHQMYKQSFAAMCVARVLTRDGVTNIINGLKLKADHADCNSVGYTASDYSCQLVNLLFQNDLLTGRSIHVFKAHINK
jgi:hypothetical protein